MTGTRFLPAMGFALCCFAASTGHCGSDTPDPGTAHDLSEATLAEIIPGQTTKAQVEAQLGQAWRTTGPGPGDPAPVAWEYRGEDSDGTYRVYIEFDANNVATLIAKIPDKTGQAQARTVQKP